jgi:hypothetical protein
VVGGWTTAYISMNFVSCFVPMPVSTRMLFPWALISRFVSDRRTRLRSSAGATFSQAGFGTMPNIAPPSRRKKPSYAGWSSNSPRRIMRSPSS